MEQYKYTLNELETLYMTEYDEDDVEDTGDEVLNFIKWMRETE